MQFVTPMNVFRSVQCAVSVGGMYIALNRVQPAPSVYVRSEVYGPHQPNPPVDPRCEIKFGNMGFGPMYIHSIKIKAKGELVSNIKDVLPKTAYTLETEALGMYKVPKQPKPFQANGSVVLLTARPAKGVDKSTFNRSFEEDLAKQRVQLCIEYSASDDRLIRWLTYRKVEIDVVSM